MSFFLGLLSNEGVNWTLKHIIREYRPNRSKCGAQKNSCIYQINYSVGFSHYLIKMCTLLFQQGKFYSLNMECHQVTHNLCGSFQPTLRSFSISGIESEFKNKYEMKVEFS